MMLLVNLILFCLKFRIAFAERNENLMVEGLMEYEFYMVA